jgi:hypothetical protein
VVHNASLQADAGSAMAMVTLKATHEPSIVVMAQGQQPKLTAAVDELGHSLVPDASQVMVRPRQSFSWGRLLARAVGATEPAPDPSEFWTAEENGINIQLQCPPDFGHTLAKLEGTQRFLIQRRAARLELPIASSPVDQDKTIGGVSITIGGWQVFSPQQQMFRVTIHRTHQDQTQWNRLSASVGALNPVLLDAAGEPLPELRHMGSNAGDPDCFCQFMCIQNNYEGGQFRGRTPVKLVMDVPTEFVAIDVPFKFENLPLP